MSTTSSTESKIFSSTGCSKIKVITEDIGKTIEFTIYQVIGTEFKGNFKYSMDRVARLQERFSFLKTVLKGYKYTGSESNLNDFEKEEEIPCSEAVNLYHLSVKIILEFTTLKQIFNLTKD